MKSDVQKLLKSQRFSRFGPFRIDFESQVLFKNEAVVSIPPKVMATLLVLVRSRGEIISKAELMSRVWPETFVEEGSLTQNISLLRKVLGDDVIDTIPKRGYRFLPATGEQIEEMDEPAGTPTETEFKGSRPSHGFLAVLAALSGVIFLVLMQSGNSRKGSPIIARSIAVLPFANFSPEADTEYLSDGLTEELIHVLKKVDGLRVVARTSSFQFKGKANDLRRVGKELQVGFVLEGSIQKDGSRLRVTAQLIDASTGFHLWSERFDRQFRDIFAIQDEICAAVTQALAIQLAGAAAGPWRGVRPTENLEVYMLYLRGLKEWNHRNRAGVSNSRELFEQAVALDPDYAPAWAGLADAWIHHGIWSLAPPGEAFPQAKAAALRALELAPQLAGAHTSLGYVKGWYERDHAGAEVSYRHAVALSPGFSWGRQRLAGLLSAAGRHEEAIQESRRALELDPISASASAGLALTLFWARLYDQAIEQCIKARQLDPQFPLTYYYLAHAYEQRRRYGEVLAALTEGGRLWGSSERKLLAHSYAVSGRRAEALEILDQIRKQPDGGANEPYDMALIHAALGDKDAALSWLERAVREYSVWAMFANVDPRLDGVRSEPRFQQVLKTLGFYGKWENLWYGRENR